MKTAFSTKHLILGLGILSGALTLGWIKRHDIQHRVQVLQHKNYELGTYQWQLGQERQYRLEATQAGTFRLQFFHQGDQSPSKLPELPLNIKLQGHLFWLPYEKSNNLTLVALRIEAETFSFSFGQPQPALEKALMEELRLEHAIAIAPNGTIQGFQFAENTQPVTRNLIRQMILEAVPGLTMGNNEDEVLNGWQKNEYQGSCNSQICRIQKEAISFRTRSSDDQKASVTGNASFELDSALSGIQKMQSTRRFTLMKSGHQVQDETLDISLVLLTQKTVDSTRLSQLTQTMNGRFTSIAGLEEFAAAERQAMQKLIEGRDFTTELARLKDFSDKATISDMMDLYRMLQAFITLHPEKIPELARELYHYASKDNRFDFIGVVLARNGSEDAQSQLVESIEQKWNDPQAVQQLSMSLALMENPSDATAQRLLEQLDRSSSDEASRSVLLSTVAGVGYHSPNAEIKNEIRDRIYKEIDQANSSLEKKDAYMVLGNLGHNDTPAYVAPLLASPKAEDRVLAVTALRRVDKEASRQADQILVQTSEVDAAKEVRRASSSALIGRNVDVDLLKALEQRLYAEKDINVVQNIVDTLSHHPTQKETARQILENYLLQCGTPAICKKVEQALLSQ
jgi:hypothetical protein